VQVGAGVVAGADVLVDALAVSMITGVRGRPSPARRRAASPSPTGRRARHLHVHQHDVKRSAFSRSMPGRRSPPSPRSTPTDSRISCTTFWLVGWSSAQQDATPGDVDLLRLGRPLVRRLALQPLQRHQDREDRAVARLGFDVDVRPSARPANG